MYLNDISADCDVYKEFLTMDFMRMSVFPLTNESFDDKIECTKANILLFKWKVF